MILTMSKDKPIRNPKVSILIPTYNRPSLFVLALKSALKQTYKNIEIIVCDDSTNNDTKELMKTYLEAHPHIRYYKNRYNLGQFQNDLQLFDLATGEYVNYLMDDDLFHPRKIEKMVRYFIEDENEKIALVTSHRQRIDEKGETLPALNVTKQLYQRDTIMNGKRFADFMLGMGNVIGEPTTVLFRKKWLEEPFGTYAGRKYGCAVDLATWMNLLEKGDIVYIAETLSYFRIHSAQQLHSDQMVIYGAGDYAHLVLEAHARGFLQQPAERRKAIECSLQFIDNALQIKDVYEKYREHILEIMDYKRKLEELYTKSFD